MSVHVVEIVLTPGLLANLGREAKKDILTALTTTDGILFGLNCGLFTNDMIPTPATPHDNYAAPIWTGYALQAITWNAAAFEGVFGATVEAVSVDWLSNADADETVYGLWLPDASGNFAAAFHRFATPLVVQGVQSITAVITLDIG